MFPLLLLFLALAPPSAGIPIDNDVIGDAEIECGSSSVGISFNTKNPFEGQVFVKGLSNQEGCAQMGQGLRTGFIILPFESCNVQRTRSLNPRGVFVVTTVIISFHMKFLTKVDRAYKIQCFYMEADKTVSAELEVSPLTTALQTENVPMPVCRYDILDGGPDGQPIQYVLVGQQVYHKWTCDTDTVNVFCMVVHSCFVDDGTGDQVQLIDGEGCAVDKYLLRNLEYPTDLMAGQESHAFKYADKSNLFYQCQIAITVKEPNQECSRPQCPELRLRRDLTRLPSLKNNVDVSYAMESFDIDDGDQRPLLIESDNDQICMSNAGFGSLIIVSTLIFAASLTATLVCFWKRHDILERRKAARKIRQAQSAYYYGY